MCRHVSRSDECIEQLRRPDNVDHAVSRRLQERLTRPGLGGQVNDDVGTNDAQERIPTGSVNDVKRDNVGRVSEDVGRPGLVNLGMEDVGDENLIATITEASREATADEAGAASHQDLPRRHSKPGLLAPGSLTVRRW